jgi:hypothetical protein
MEIRVDEKHPHSLMHAMRDMRNGLEISLAEFEQEQKQSHLLHARLHPEIWICLNVRNSRRARWKKQPLQWSN